MEYLYKYRSLANMKRFIDILMNRRYNTDNIRSKVCSVAT